MRIRRLKLSFSFLISIRLCRTVTKKQEGQDQKEAVTMARRSKRLHAGPKQQNVPEKKYYKVGIYARLSSDQNERKKESIGIQIDMARRFAENWNQNHGDKMVVVGCYTDKGKTGTNFDRDAFKRLMQDIRLGKINCIIVKDLSRFGRNYLEAGNYIEKIFPFLGVRFIAVSDGYDTGADGNNARQMASEIMNLVKNISCLGRVFC